MTKNRLKDLRKATGKTQKDFYSEIVVTELNLGVTLRTYQNWEKPENEIKSKPANSLANYFGVSASYLLGYSDYKNSKDISQALKSQSQKDINDFVKNNIFKNYLELDIEATKKMSGDYDFNKNINILKTVSDIFVDKHNEIFSMFYAKEKIGTLEDEDFTALENFLKFYSDYTIKNSDYNTVFQDMLTSVIKKYRD